MVLAVFCSSARARLQCSTRAHICACERGAMCDAHECRRLKCIFTFQNYFLEVLVCKKLQIKEAKA